MISWKSAETHYVCVISTCYLEIATVWITGSDLSVVKAIKTEATSNYELLANATHKQYIDCLEMSHKTSHQ